MKIGPFKIHKFLSPLDNFCKFRKLYHLLWQVALYEGSGQIPVQLTWDLVEYTFLYTETILPPKR